MSTQSLHTNTIASLSESLIKDIQDNTKKLLLKERFRLGEGMCETSQAHALKLCEIIEKNNCVLDNYLLKIMRYGPDCKYDANVTVTGGDSTNQQAEDLYGVWLGRGNKGNYDAFLDMLFNVNVDVWEEAEW